MLHLFDNPGKLSPARAFKLQNHEIDKPHSKAGATRTLCNKRIPSRSFASIVAAIGLLLLTQSVFAQQIYYVDASATGNNNGSSWEHAFTQLAPLTSNLSPGDQVWVRSGVYSRTTGVLSGTAFIIAHGVEVYGGFNGTETSLDQRDWEANPTVLTANYQNTPADPFDALEDASDLANLSGNYSRVVRFRTGASETAVLDGFIITGGNGAEGAGVYVPGSLENDPGIFPVLRNLHIEGNRSNTNSGHGGGLYAIINYPTLVENVTFKRNYAYRGGGYAHTLSTGEDGPVFRNVHFIENVAIDYPEGDGRIDGGTGGGAQPTGGTIYFDEVLFENNSAERFGGGITVFSESLNHSVVHIRNAKFFNNTSPGAGAVHANGLNTSTPLSLFITNALFTGNSGSAASAIRAEFSSPVRLANVTVTGNGPTNTGAFNNGTSSTVITNSIFHDNDGFDVFSSSGNIQVNHSIRSTTLNVSDGGGNIISQDPMFVDAPNGVFQIRNSSPARNAGNTETDFSVFPTDSNDNPIDLAGEPRVQDGNISMGAFETTIGDPPAASDITIQGQTPLALSTPISDAFVSPDEFPITRIRIESLPENGTLSVNNAAITSVPLVVSSGDFASLEYVPDDAEVFGPNTDQFEYAVGDDFQFSSESYTASISLDVGPPQYRSLSTVGASSGIGAVVTQGDTPLFDFSEPFTIEFWIKPDEYEDSPTVFSNIGDDEGGFLLMVGVELGISRIALAFQDDFGGVNYFLASESEVPPAGEWYHVAYVNENSSDGMGRILVNGEDVTFDVRPSEYTLISNTNDIRIGYGVEGSEATQFRGNLADLRIWDSALSDEQINERLYEYMSGTETGLLANYIASPAGGGESSLETPVGPAAVLTEGSRIASDDYRPFGFNITGDEGWRLISSAAGSSSFATLLEPVWTQGFPGADIPGFGTPNVLIWNESDQLFAPIDNAGNNPAPGTGFIAYIFDDDNFDGEPNGFPKVLHVDDAPNFGEVAPAISWTDTGSEENDGWNLVGNPYGSTIDWNAPEGWTRTNLDASFYVWNAATNEYQSWNGLAGTLPDARIASWQGFWVKASGENPTLRMTEQTRSDGGTRYRREVIPQIQLELTSGDQVSGSLVMFSEKARVGSDPFDAYKLQPLSRDYVSLFTLSENGKSLDINALPLDLQETVEIPLSFESTLSDNMARLSWENQSIPVGWGVTLTDHETGTSIDMLGDETSYTFAVNRSQKDIASSDIRDASDSPNHVLIRPGLVRKSAGSDSRFTLTLEPSTTGTTDDATDIPETVVLGQNYPNPFNPSTTIHYALPAQADVRLEVFNMLGQVVGTLVSGTVEAGHHTVTFDGSQFASGIYVYRLQLSTGQVLTRKFTLIK